jgi:hypothetical protein
MTDCHCGKAEDRPTVNGDIGCPDMMAELVLPGVAAEKLVELLVS